MNYIHGVFITRCDACGAKVRYHPKDEAPPKCSRCGTIAGAVQRSDGDRGAATYNGEIEQLLPWGLALPD